jgi:hypothetical protein
MGHKIFDFKRQRLMLDAPLADWLGWSLAIDCSGQRCPRRRIYEVADLAQAHPARPLLKCLNRMRCSIYGGGVHDTVMLRLRTERKVETSTLGYTAALPRWSWARLLVQASAAGECLPHRINR